AVQREGGGYLGAIEEREAFLGRARERLRMAHLADAEEREGKMRERREIAGRAERALRRNARIEAAVVEIEQPLDKERPHAGIAAREALNLEREGQAHGRVIEKWAGARGVREDDVSLQLFELVVGDARLRKAAEAGV